MTLKSHRYVTKGGICISRSTVEISRDTAIENLLSSLNSRRGGLLSSSYEYPGRYKRWAIGFINPPLELATRDRNFTITAHNDRGKLLLPFLAERLWKNAHLQEVILKSNCIVGSVVSTTEVFQKKNAASNLRFLPLFANCNKFLRVMKTIAWDFTALLVTI